MKKQILAPFIMMSALIITTQNQAQLVRLPAHSPAGIDCKLDENGVSLLAPQWHSVPGVMHTGVPCPAKVGIGIAAPVEQLHVVCSGRFTGALGIGTAADITAKLIINQPASSRSGVVINYTPTSPNGTGVGVQINMASDTRKAFVVSDGSFMPKIVPTVIENEIAQSATVNIEPVKISKTDSTENQVDLLMANVLKNQLTVTVVSGSKYQEIEIYSLDGKLVLVSNFLNNQIILNVEHLSSGIYIIKTKDESNIILTSKFVKL